jgi:hypothetical protein
MSIYKIESLDEKKVVKIIYDNKKEDINFKIGDIEKVDIDKAIKLLSTIGTKNAINWTYLLEIAKSVGWNKLNDLSYLNDIKQHLSIEYINHYALLMYKHKFKIAEFAIPKAVDVTINLLFNETKKSFDIISKKDELIKLFENAINSDDIYPYFQPIRKISKGEEAFKINFLAILYIDLADKFFENDRELNESFKLQIVDVYMKNVVEIINKMPKNKKILIELDTECKDLLKYASKYKDLFARESIKHFFETLEKTSELGYAIFDTDIKFNDISFIVHSNIGKYGDLYKKYYLIDAMEQLKNNKFYGFEFDNDKIVNIFDFKYLEPYNYLNAI